MQVLTITDAVAVGAGLGHACAVLADDTVTCWGGNVDGQLGDGTSYSTRTSPQVRSTPVPVSFT